MNYIPSSMPFLVLIGPSAVGKSTLAAALHAAGLVDITASWTTRPKREGEADDFEHIFCTDTQFDEAEAAGKFLDTVHPFKDTSRYGLPRIPQPPVGMVPLVLLRSFVIAKLLEHYDHPYIYQIEASKESVRERLTIREQSGSETADRLTMYEQEIAQGRALAHRLFENESIETLTAAVTAAIREDFKLS